MNATENRILYLRWLRAAQPSAYAQAMRALRGDGRLGADWSSIIGAVTSAAGAVMQKKQQDKQFALQKKQMEIDAEAQKAATLLTVNTQRAQAGLPPVDINGNVIPGSQLPAATSVLQQAGAAVGVPANSGAFASGNAIYYILGGFGLLAVVLLMKR